jgi:hypothetical protein
MAFMYVCWLPIPIVVYQILRDYEFLIVGTIFGIVSLAILILTMVLQASHLTYSAIHYKEDAEFWNKNDNWMLNGLLGGQVELLALVLKGIWVMFITICFWLQGDVLWFSLAAVSSLFSVAYLINLLDLALVRKLRFLKLIKINSIVINLETFAWFAFLTVWLVATV